MSIGLLRGTVALEPHDPQWDINAKQTIERLKLILKDIAVDIQHIGSTAIREIQAKPIIDLVIGVSDFPELLERNPVLEANGFLYRSQDHPDQHLYVCGDDRFITHHLHAVIYRAEAWNHYVNMRDYLNTHPDEAAAYSELKQALAIQYANDRMTYTSMKSDLIQQILAHADQWKMHT